MPTQSKNKAMLMIIPRLAARLWRPHPLRLFSGGLAFAGGDLRCRAHQARVLALRLLLLSMANDRACADLRTKFCCLFNRLLAIGTSETRVIPIAAGTSGAPVGAPVEDGLRL